MIHRWRLGLDLGTSSLGWCALRLGADGRPDAVLAAGSRIFGGGEHGAGREAKSGKPLGEGRRDARAMRRRRDRYLRRRTQLIARLVRYGLFPADPAERKALESLDPFALRARALDEKLTPFEIGRALFHLNQRRGFKSNRKTDRGKDDDAGKIAVGVDRLADAIEESGARTFGEFLHRRRAGATDLNAVPSVRTRLRPETGEGAKGTGYDFYPGRALIEDEFDAILVAQAGHHPGLLTQEVVDALSEVVFYQRPLKQPKIGTCTLVPGEARLPKAHPLFQRRRLLEEVNALMVERGGALSVRLTRPQRDALLTVLKATRSASFVRLRKALKLPPEARFNKETEHRTELKGDEVAAELGAKTRFGKRWANLSAETQWTIVRRLVDEEDEAQLRTWLEAEHGLTPAAAKATAAARLPAGYGRFGETATRRLIAALEADVIVYSEAVVAADLGHHSDFRTGEVFLDEKGRPALPYYGLALEAHIMPGTAEPADPEEMRVGRLTNPTVHIGLNQLRRTVNKLIRAYGPPAEIAVELARELKLTLDEKRERERENTRNRLDAKARSDKLVQIEQRDSGANRALLKLWEELNPGNVCDRRCVYSGKLISPTMLFSGEVEVDHILPFEMTLDDSNANKIVCLREENRKKGKQSPFQAFSHRPDWDEIAERAARLPATKRWRFQPDAMERFVKDEGFVNRQLVDTQYLSRLARQYLTTLYPETGEGSSKVWVSPGRMTEMVRRKLKLNDLLSDHNLGAEQPKNRKDHRHHAVDAAVIAIIDRPMLQKIAHASGLEGEAGRERIVVEPPWEGFRDELRAAVGRIVVSHRPDHGLKPKATLKQVPPPHMTAGRLHNDTAYGLTGERDARGNTIVVHRVPLGTLKPDMVARVRDTGLRDALAAFTRGLEGKAFEAKLAAFPELGPIPYRGIRRVRVTEPLAVIPVRDGNGRAYKGYKGDSNYRYDVWELKDGRWVAEVVSMFDVHQPGRVSRVRAENPTARKVLSLHRDDVLAIERDDARELVRVVKFSEKQLALAPPHEGGKLKERAADKDDPFNYVYPSPSTLKTWKTRQVRVDELGRVADPGFPARTARRRTRPKPA